MDTATPLAFLMGLSSAALILLFIFSISSGPSISLCLVPSHCPFPAIKSVFVEYFFSMWSLFIRFYHDPILFTPRNLFLLVNFIILFLLISLHLQQHAPAAAGKRSSRKKKLIVNHQQPAPLQNFQRSSFASDLAGEEAAAMVKEALIISSAEERPENVQSEESAPLQESFMSPAEGAEESPAVDSGCINGSDVERIVMEEDGRLRLIVGHGDTNGADQAEGVVVEEEDGELRLIDEGTDGSDQIVLEEDGRLRLIDRPQLPSSSGSMSRPRKSRSTGDDNKYRSDDNYDQNEIINAINLNYDNGHSPINKEEEEDDTESLEKNSRNHNKIQTNLNDRDASLSSSRMRPMRAKKADSLDATWKAINHNKLGSYANTGRDHTRLIRQSSRQDFKASSRSAAGAHAHIMNYGHSATRASRQKPVRREPSISQDELNAKVESFIAKFNEQIRLQRQQSLVSYMQMVDRGA